MKFHLLDMTELLYHELKIAVVTYTGLQEAMPVKNLSMEVGGPPYTPPLDEALLAVGSFWGGILTFL